MPIGIFCRKTNAHPNHVQTQRCLPCHEYLTRLYDTAQDYWRVLVVGAITNDDLICYGNPVTFKSR